MFFNQESYDKLKKSKQFKIFSLYCYLGFTIFAWVLMLFVLAIISFIPKCNSADTMHEIMSIFVIVFICVTILVEIITTVNLFFRKPCLCEYGIIKNIATRRAEIDVNDNVIKAISFENFLKNQKLDKYKSGDNVLIYSSDKKLRRPMFYKV